MQIEPTSNPEEATIEKLTKLGREATKFEFETLNFSEDCFDAVTRIDEDLLNKVLKYDLNSFLLNRASERRNCFRKINHEIFFKYSPKCISGPITILPRDLYDNAIAIYKSLLAYSANKNPIDSCKAHLAYCFNSTEDFKDEAYAQVIKQLIENPDR